MPSSVGSIVRSVDHNLETSDAPADTDGRSFDSVSQDPEYKAAHLRESPDSMPSDALPGDAPHLDVGPSGSQLSSPQGSTSDIGLKDLHSKIASLRSDTTKRQTERLEERQKFVKEHPLFETSFDSGLLRPPAPRRPPSQGPESSIASSRPSTAGTGDTGPGLEFATPGSAGGPDYQRVTYGDLPPEVREMNNRYDGHDGVLRDGDGNVFLGRDGQPIFHDNNDPDLVRDENGRPRLDTDGNLVFRF